MNVRPLMTLLAMAGTMLGASLAACTSNPESASTQSVADAGPGAHHNPIRAALAAITLTPAQQTQIDGFRQQARAAREAGNPEPRGQMIKQIEGVLTPDQLATFKSTLDRERRDHRDGQPAASPSPA